LSESKQLSSSHTSEYCPKENDDTYPSTLSLRTFLENA
jgi:hypothetical protein